MIKKISSFLLVGLFLFSAVAAQAADEYGKTLSGKILLAVEDQGKAYYIDFNGQAHYLQDADSAFKIMRNLAQGINKSGSRRIKQNDKSFNLQRKGKLFLAVEENGEVYYLDFNGNAHYLKDGLTAYRVMRGLSLGISNANLAKITIAGETPKWLSDTRKQAITEVLGDKLPKPVITETDSLRKIALDFVNNNLLSGRTAEITGINLFPTKLYKLNILLEGEKIDSYITADGQLFFPQSINIKETQAKVDNPEADSTPATKPAPTDLVKSDKPVVELFVMSHCPYGTQMEKGIIPAVEALGSKIDFQLKFVDYAMHGKKEVDEQLNQYCVGQQGQAMFFTYLKCFLKASAGASCLTEAKVDTGKLTTCTADTDKKFKINELYADQSSWQGGSYSQFNIYKTDNDKYGVGGSPTLIINGKEVSGGRDSASLLSTICAAFNTAPTECATVLSSATPAPGFGSGVTESEAAAACH